MPRDTELAVIVLPDGFLHLEWVEAVTQGLARAGHVVEEDIFSCYTQEPNDWLFFAGFFQKGVPLSPSLAYWCSFSALFSGKLKHTPELEALRHRVTLSLGDEERRRLLESAPPMTGGEYLTGATLDRQWQALHEIFSRKITAYAGSVEGFLKEYSPDIHLAGRIYFHLVENKGHDLPFAFLATYSTRLDETGASRHLPLKYALEEYKDDNEKLLNLLATVDTAARKSELVAHLRDSGELFHPLGWSSQEAYEFLREIPIYEDAGILCRIPDWWKKKSAAVTMRMSIGERSPSAVGMDALLDFSPHLMIGDTEITPQEARRLLEESEGLIFLKNKWVAVDPEKLRQTLDAFERAAEIAEHQGISLLDALKISAGTTNSLGDGAADHAGVSHGEWLKTFFRRLHTPDSMAAVSTSRNFKATLRHYQQAGLNWLFYLNSMQLGACLADDMGLGKTIQILAFLDVLKKQNRKSTDRAASLLVIPTSLLANWSAEIASFVPSLRVFVAHPEAHRPSPVPVPTKNELNGFDVVITTYGLAKRYTWLQDYRWDCIILDEAQAIKNHTAKQTRAVKSLRAEARIVMTGTPVENRLSDLWSLFDFINPGLLGNAAEFGAFTKHLGVHPKGYAGLRRMVRPFILRRLKTDKAIIADLPDKVEVKTWAAMSKKQTVLYSEMVSAVRTTLESVDGMQRRGLILSTLMKCKQLCNHPSQYLGLDGFSEKESGKFIRLREICETIHAKRERVLIFTQFKEMTGPLARFLETIFQRPGLILHGGVAVGARRKLVETFQGRDYVPFFVLSLKAGGVGLNLTAANHVVHFDRWWNPAVENQATDRVFRIGQKKNVMVHKFLTRGTIEEKIDRMLVDKATLADEVVAAGGENWLTEMSDEELGELFSMPT
jgi:hypothetical protein